MNNDGNTMKTNYGMGFTIQSIIDENADLLKINPSSTVEGKDKVSDVGLWSGLDAQAAFLGPNIWDSPNNADFKLEQLDLSDFLGENDLVPAALASPAAPSPPVSPPLAEALVSPLPSPPQQPSLTELQQLQHQPQLPQHPPQIRQQPPPPQIPQQQPPPQPQRSASVEQAGAEPRPAGRRERPPRAARLPVKFRVSEADLALASAPGVQFDPQTRQFSDDELKPQPMCKKSKKQVVPEEAKDQKYWTRRERNNHAAKRSREARRLKENQIVLRANFLEKENLALRESIDEITRENERLKARLAACSCP